MSQQIVNTSWAVEGPLDDTEVAELADFFFGVAVLDFKDLYVNGGM